MAPRQKKSKATRAAEKKQSEKVHAEKQKAHRSFLQSEKDIVPKFQQPPPDHFGHQKLSPLWKFAVHIDWPQFSNFISSHDPKNLEMYKGFQRINDAFKAAQEEQEQLAKKSSPNKTEKLLPFSIITKRCVLCPLCLQNPDTPLSNAIIMLSRSRPSNIKQHTDGNHKDFVIPGTKEDAQAQSEPEQGTTQTKMTMFRDGSGMITKKTIRQQMQQHIYQCVNDCCLPASIVEKPEFRKMIDFAIKNANLLRESQPEKLSRREVTSMRVTSYQEFIRTISKLSFRVRQHYKKICRQEIPFATVCHDVWQAKRYDVLGVTVMFCDPRNCAIYRIPIGLAQTKGHTAVQVAKLTHSLLQTVGFHKTDLCSSVNDNTASAVLAGKYITSSSAVGKCDMHKAELVLKHATGLVVRTKNKEIIDDNKSFVELYTEFKKFAAWLMSKKANHRFDNVREDMERMNQSVVQIPLPNETRVSGCVLTIQYLLRNKWCFDDYVNRNFGTDPDFKDKYPDQDKWELLAQYEAILVVLQEASISIQSDEPGSSSAALMQIYLARAHTHRMQTTKEAIGCLPVTLTTPRDKRWNGDKTIPQLQRVGMSFKDLKSGPRKLIRRILAEFKTLLVEGRRKRDDGGSLNDDSEKALMAHPLTTNMFGKFFQSLGVYDQNDANRVKDLFLKDMVRKFSNKAYSTIGSLLSKQAQQTTSTTTGTTTSHSTTTTSPTEQNTTSTTTNMPFQKFNPFRAFRESEELNERALLSITGKASLADEESRMAKVLKQTCEDSLRDFRRACKRDIDTKWNEVIAKYPTEAYTNDYKKWKPADKSRFLLACQDRDFLAVGKYFDVMAWWDHNKDNFPHVFPSAVIWLTKPATNAFQERVFSLGSWFQQNKLQSKTTAKNFEMRAMEKLTRKIRLEIVQREIAIENKKREAEVIAIDDDDDDEAVEKTAETATSTGGTSTDTGNMAKEATEVQATEVGNTDDTPSNTQDTDTSHESAIGNEKKKTPHLFEDTEQAEYLRNMLLMKATKALDDFNSKAKKSSEQDPLATNSPDPTYEYFPDLGDGEGEAEVPMTADDIQVVKIDLSDVSDNEEDNSVVEDEDIDNDEAITFHLREEIERLDCLEKSRKLATEEKKKRAASKDKDKGTNVEPTTGTSGSGSKKRKANETPPVQKKAKQTKLKSTGSKSGSKKKPSSRIKSKEDRESQPVRRSPRAKKKKGETPESAVRVQDSEAGSDTEENVASNLEHMLNKVAGDSHSEENDSDAEYSNEGERDDTGDNDNREEDEAEDSASE